MEESGNVCVPICMYVCIVYVCMHVHVLCVLCVCACGMCVLYVHSCARMCVVCVHACAYMCVLWCVCTHALIHACSCGRQRTTLCPAYFLEIRTPTEPEFTVSARLAVQQAKGFCLSPSLSTGVIHVVSYWKFLNLALLICVLDAQCFTCKAKKLWRSNDLMFQKLPTMELERWLSGKNTGCSTRQRRFNSQSRLRNF